MLLKLIRLFIYVIKQNLFILVSIYEIKKNFLSFFKQIIHVFVIGADKLHNSTNFSFGKKQILININLEIINKYFELMKLFGNKN